VNSLAYEADMRLRDPVYGCVGVISILQHNLRQLQQDLARAKYELSKYQVMIARGSDHFALSLSNACRDTSGCDTCVALANSSPCSLFSSFQAAAAAASASTGPNGPQAMAEFIGSAMPNGAHNFINIGHSAALGSIGGSPAVFGQEQFANSQMLSRSYDGEPIARLGINGGYEFGYSTAMGGAGPVSGLGTLGISPFLKSGTAGGDEKPSAGQ
jgi:hypothetical protein